MSLREALAGCVVLVLGSTLACAQSPPRAPLSDGRYVMGTVLEIAVYVPGRADGHALLDQLFRRSVQLERISTRFDPESDLSRLNRNAGRGPQRVHPELARLLSESSHQARLTHGSFDMTIGPLVELWIDAAAEGRRPPAAALARARLRVGFQLLRVDVESATAELLRPGMSVDLGGIAKGFALDGLVAELRRASVESALLSFGQSSLHAHGAPPGEEGWRVLLRDAAGGFAGVVTLRDQALSVSGSLGQDFEIEGRRHGHIINPRSGEPLTQRRLAAVAAASGARAEALAKALLILGEQDGISLLEQVVDAEGLLIDAGGERWATSGWAHAVRFEPTLGARARHQVAASGHCETAAHGEGLPCDEARLLGGQESHRGGDVVGQTQASHGRRARQSIEHTRGVRIRVLDRAEQRRIGETRTDTVGRHSVARGFARDRLGERDESALGARVDGLER